MNADVKRMRPEFRAYPKKIKTRIEVVNTLPCTLKKT